MINHPLYLELNKYTFVLASTSARRLEILNNNLQIRDIEIIASDFEENLSKSEYSNIDYVKNTALEKGKSVLKKLEEKLFQNDYLILSSDTIISCNGKVYEKPGTKETQFQMFQDYKRNRELQVITSVNVFKTQGGSSKVFSDVAITTLKFDDDLPDEFLHHYIESEEGLNVAGGFMYQSLGSLLFKSINGDYFNVVGLPVNTTFKLLLKAVGLEPELPNKST